MPACSFLIEKEMDYPVDYAAALTGAVFFSQPQAGLLSLNGPDRIAFLQRQTTGDVARLSAGRGLLTVLTSPVAHILDVFYLFIDPQESDAAAAQETIYAITLPGRGPSTAGYLKRRIFFNDNLTLSDLSGEKSQIDLFGPAAVEALTALGASALPNPGQLATLKIGAARPTLLRMPESIGLGYRILVPVSAAADLADSLKACGAVSLSQESYEVLRVEAGLPGAGHELTEEFNPLETNLREAVSDSKGCYTGQEVIARQITYDKVTRRLVGLKLDAAVPPGTALRKEAKPAGVITSVVDSPRFGPIALAVVKRPHFEIGEELIARLASGEVRAVVASLPFEA